MKVTKIALVILAVLIVGGLIYIGVKDAAKNKDFDNLQKVQIKSREADIKELDVKYDVLNKELHKASTEKNVNQEQLDKLNQEKQELENQKKDLEAQLQAKLEQKSKLALASSKAVNTLTATQTASAAPAPSGGSLEQIVRTAAIRNGLDPDWFWGLAKCESTWNPGAVNYNYYENGYPSGLFQHISGYWPARAAQYGYPGASVFDAEANANVTAQMWRSGSQLWECQ